MDLNSFIRGLKAIEVGIIEDYKILVYFDNHCVARTKFMSDGSIYWDGEYLTDPDDSMQAEVSYILKEVIGSIIKKEKDELMKLFI